MSSDKIGSEHPDWGPPTSPQSASYFCTKCLRNHINYRGEIYNEHWEYALLLPREWLESVEDACMDRQKTVPELVEYYIQQGLLSDGIDPETGELLNTDK